jgi:hypothetical protein
MDFLPPETSMMRPLGSLFRTINDMSISRSSEVQVYVVITKKPRVRLRRLAKAGFQRSGQSHRTVGSPSDLLDIDGKCHVRFRASRPFALYDRHGREAAVTCRKEAGGFRAESVERLPSGSVPPTGNSRPTGIIV